jgi:hypothetical protein
MFYNLSVFSLCQVLKQFSFSTKFNLEAYKRMSYPQQWSNFNIWEQIAFLRTSSFLVLLYCLQCMGLLEWLSSKYPIFVPLPTECNYSKLFLIYFVRRFPFWPVICKMCYIEPRGSAYNFSSISVLPLIWKILCVEATRPKVCCRRSLLIIAAKRCKLDWRGKAETFVSDIFKA